MKPYLDFKLFYESLEYKDRIRVLSLCLLLIRLLLPTKSVVALDNNAFLSKRRKKEGKRRMPGAGKINNYVNLIIIKSSLFCSSSKKCLELFPI